MREPALLTWVVRHGVVRAQLRRAARAGDLHARLSIDPRAREDPHPVYREIRDRGPVSRGSVTLLAAGHGAAEEVLRNGDFQVGFDHVDTHRVLRRTLSRGLGRSIGPIAPPSMLVVNPPRHARYRRQVARVFTPRVVEALEPGIRAAARDLLDDLDPLDDLAARYARLLPLRVISELFAVPPSLEPQLLAWGDAAALSLDVGLPLREFLDTRRGVEELTAWMAGHLRRMRLAPGDDLLSRLIAQPDEGGPMTDAELVATIALVLAAGFETTMTLVAGGARLLAEHPDQLAELRADPGLWDNAVEEVLRLESPVQETLRCAVTDTSIGTHGVGVGGGEVIPVSRGTFVGVLLGAANRDPYVFPDPDLFDVRRANARDHLAFSAGIHHCLGSGLARLEGRIALQELFDRYPDLALAGRPVMRPTRTLRGYLTMPVRLRAGRHAATVHAGHHAAAQRAVRT
jgi:cytochrome P450